MKLYHLYEKNGRILAVAHHPLPVQERPASVRRDGYDYLALGKVVYATNPKDATLLHHFHRSFSVIPEWDGELYHALDSALAPPALLSYLNSADDEYLVIQSGGGATIRSGAFDFRDTVAALQSPSAHRPGGAQKVYQDMGKFRSMVLCRLFEDAMCRGRK